MAIATQPIDEARLMAVLGQAVGDFGAVGSAALVLIGDRLGLYKTLAARGPLTAAELARQTGTSERYIQPWLVNQASAGFAEYDPATERFSLSVEQAAALADDDSPFNIVGGYQLMTAAIKAQTRIEQVFRSGEGMGWGEHDSGLFEGTERFFRSGYRGNLVQSWIPALDGVQRKLEQGATVADVGCGHGASTIILAQAYPNSRFFGFDNHAPSIEAARNEAKAAGVGAQVTFEVASAQDYPGRGYDLVAYFDCLHDMADPLTALRHGRASLDPDGTILVVEPMAGDDVQGNLNPVGRVYSSASVLICTPNGLVGGGNGLATLATERQFRDLAASAGLSRFRRATETPFNRIFEARL